MRCAADGATYYYESPQVLTGTLGRAAGFRFRESTAAHGAMQTAIRESAGWGLGRPYFTKG